MTPEDVFESAIRLVPQWYRAGKSPYRFNLEFDGKLFEFCSLRNLTPNLRHFWDQIKTCFPKLVEQAATAPPAFCECVQEVLVKRWLASQHALMDWDKLIGHLRILLNRTCENLPVSVNLVIDESIGTTDITNPTLNKFFDQLATSPYTFLRIDRMMRFLSYEEIPWSTITEPASYTFHPDFLHPFHCVLNSCPTALLSVHVTRNRDVVIMNKEGIIAARRKGEWKTYDVKTFKNSLGVAMRDYSMGANLFAVLFDLEPGDKTGIGLIRGVVPR